MYNSFYDRSEEHEKRGVDYDLFTCLRENPQDHYSVDDIEKVLAVWEGENDGDSWRWILQLKEPVMKNRLYVYLNGWCDYTGWDCRSGASSEHTNSPEGAALCEIANNDGTLDDLAKTEDEVYKSLISQLVAGKNETWEEEKAKEFGKIKEVNLATDNYTKKIKQRLEELKNRKEDSAIFPAYIGIPPIAQNDMEYLVELVEQLEETIAELKYDR